MRDGPASTLDELEAKKLRLMVFERFMSHGSNFFLVVALAFLSVDATYVLWGVVARFEIGDPIGSITRTVMSLGGVGSAYADVLIIAVITAFILSARGTMRAEPRRLRLGQYGAAVVLLAGIAFFIVQFQYMRGGAFGRLGDFFRLYVSQPFAHWTAMLEIAVILLAVVLPQWRYNVGQGALSSLTDDEALILREVPEKHLRKRFLSGALGVPHIVDYLSQGRSLTFALFVMANALFAFTTYFAVVGGGIMCFHWLMAADQCGASNPICTADKGLWFLQLTLAAVFACLIVAPLIGRMLAALAQRRIRFSVQELLQTDMRPPILFLRPFRDDQVELPKADAGLGARWSGWLDAFRNLDRLLLNEATPYGPVVAIGNPNDQFPPYGAARGYFDNKTWKQAVADLAQQSMAIVMCIDDYEGVWWEVENVVARYPEKTLVLISPSYCEQPSNSQIVAKLVQHLSSAVTGSSIVSAVAKVQDAEPAIIGTYQDRSGAQLLSRSRSFSEVAFLIQVRAFLRGKWGLASNQ